MDADCWIDLEFDAELESMDETAGYAIKPNAHVHKHYIEMRLDPPFPMILFVCSFSVKP